MIEQLNLSNCIIVFDSENDWRDFEIIEQDAVDVNNAPIFSVSGITDQERFLISEIVKRESNITSITKTLNDFTKRIENMTRENAETFELIKNLNEKLREAEKNREALEFEIQVLKTDKNNTIAANAEGIVND